jgi:hypothetical protein
LSDGKKWVVRKWNGLPTPVTYGGWLVVQAVLFKIQPWLRNGLLDVVNLVIIVFQLRLHVQLLLVVLAVLGVQTLLAESRFKRLRRIVENMDSRATSDDQTATDGGREVELEERTDDWNSGWVYAFSGAVAGGAIGVGWGPAGVIGFALLGAMLGYDLERHTFGD